jgi:hypothetical protein
VSSHFFLFSVFISSIFPSGDTQSLNMAATEIPTKQKAIIYDNPGTVSTKVVELDVPEPGANEVLINL